MRTSTLGSVEYSRMIGLCEVALISFDRSRALDTFRLESPDASWNRLCVMPNDLAFAFIVFTNAVLPPGYALASVCAARFSEAIKARRNRSARVIFAPTGMREC